MTDEERTIYLYEVATQPEIIGWEFDLRYMMTDGEFVKMPLPPESTWTIMQPGIICLN